MGEVYRARDSRLQREVALKILPAAVVTDADRLARFRREAQVLAALNHQGIAAIYGVEDSGSTHALVLELVEGPTLAERIAQGPLPVAEAFPLARQIAEALEAAHGLGIVHRDLKPANIKVRADGAVKVLDFGLAKATEAVANSGGDAMNSPTLTTPAMTQAGMILGTAAYMAPEQARGRAVDKRADVWAFGAVLFEMLTGARAFPGDDLTDTLAAVVRAEPDWSLLPADVPPTLLVYLKRCLQKDPRQRVPDMGTMRLALDGAFDTGALPAAAPAPARADRRGLMWGAAAGLAVSLAVAAVTLWARPDAVDPPTVRLSIPLPEGSELTSSPAITSDGRTVAYVARQGTAEALLYLRDLHSFETRVVSGSKGARQPFFSPDGRWVAFFAQSHLQKAEVAGGAPVRLVGVAYPFGGTWTEDDTIIYVASLGSGLLQIPARGDGTRAVVRQGLILWLHDFARGTHSPLTSGVDSNLLPAWSPDGRRILFASNRGGDWDIYSKPADGAGSEEVLLKRPFDQFPYMVAADGTLVYTEIHPTTGRDLWTLSRDGTATPLRVTQFNELAAEFVPGRDEPPRLVAYASDESGQSEIYLQSFPGGERRVPVSTGGGVRPMWSPDGRELFYVAGDAMMAVEVRPNGSVGGPRKLFDRSRFLIDDRFHSYAVSPDGRRFLMILRGADSAPRQLNVILNWRNAPAVAR